MNKTPRGIRNNNPGNIRYVGTQWRGLVGDDGAFCIFDTPENGIRAIAKVLTTYGKRGLNTIGEIIPVWAPSTENDTQSYIDAVCTDCHRNADQTLSKEDWPDFIAAIIHHENGQQPYTQDQINAGIVAAL